MPVATNATPGPDDESFYADLVVDVAPDRVVRIPSVGPGSRIARARLGVGATEIPMRVLRDGADNWFVHGYGARSAVRARLVLELVIARAAFGGPLSDPSWTDLPFVPPLPENVTRAAAVVRDAIGVNRRMRPRAVIARLVEYFRGFVDSEEPPRGHRDVYLDLALSKKGVCRHRAFAFMVTAQSMGIPTRMVLNEAHAWVEVHDGSLWRRIDLGGAGRMANPVADGADRPPYEAPPDAFGWPRDARKGDDMVAEARARGAGGSGAGSPASSGGATQASGPGPGGKASTEIDGGPAASFGSQPTGEPLAPSRAAPAPTVGDDRPRATVTVGVSGAEAHCGQPLRVRGEVRADGDACPHVAVELWLRSAGPRGAFLLGRLATGDDGVFAGSIVVPTDATRGDYDVVARTSGDARCGPGTSE
ncbi:MAG: transglutaminase domain-containing protein [Myxococcales bacterium]|nr:transglutaminase domain-containing protein [Myxococcales bacterium]